MATGEEPADDLGIPPGKKPAIKDVARLAGVAVGTVSNVLNDRPTVSPETRERVLEVIRRIGYVPNATARRLRSGEVTTIGAVVLDLANPFFTEIARGIEDRLAQDGYVLMLASSDENLDRERRYLDLLLQQGVRGVLVTPAGADLDHLREIRDRGTDVVLLDAYSREFPSVGVDDVAGGALAAAHLLDGGRSRLAFFNGPHTVRQCAERHAGVERAFLTRELDPAAVTEVTLPAPMTAELAAPRVPRGTGRRQPPAPARAAAPARPPAGRLAPAAPPTGAGAAAPRGGRPGPRSPPRRSPGPRRAARPADGGDVPQ